MVAEFVTLHEGLCPDHLELRIEALSAGIIAVTTNNIPNVRSLGLSECLGPEALGDLQLKRFCGVLDDLISQDVLPEPVGFTERLAVCFQVCQ